jgi:hypothetical protein
MFKNTKKAINKVQSHAVVPMMDLVLGRTMSKKLMVFLIATSFILTQYLTGQEWIEVAKWYFGAQGATDVALALKGNKKDHKLNDHIEPGNEDKQR